MTGAYLKRAINSEYLAFCAQDLHRLFFHIREHEQDSLSCPVRRSNGQLPDRPLLDAPPGGGYSAVGRIRERTVPHDRVFVASGDRPHRAVAHHVSTSWSPSTCTGEPPSPADATIPWRTHRVKKLVENAIMVIALVQVYYFDRLFVFHRAGLISAVKNRVTSSATSR